MIKRLCDSLSNVAFRFHWFFKVSCLGGLSCEWSEMANFVKKSDILRHLWANEITPKHNQFERTVEAFLLEKFELQTHQVDPRSLERLKKDVLDYRRKLRRFCKHDAYRKETFLTKHEVREFVSYWLW